jgi:hypothetical protein
MKAKIYKQVQVAAPRNRFPHARYYGQRARGRLCTHTKQPELRPGHQEAI